MRLMKLYRYSYSESLKACCYVDLAHRLSLANLFTYLLHGATILVELAASHIPHYSLPSAVLNLHLLIPIFLRSSSTLSIHLLRGFPLFLLSPCFPSIAFWISLFFHPTDVSQPS
jgi:hypothetical protein